MISISKGVKNKDKNKKNKPKKEGKGWLMCLRIWKIMVIFMKLNNCERNKYIP